MKILYITTFYSYRDSSAAVRNNALVKGLIELGHTVDVQTVRYPSETTSPNLSFGNIYFTDVFNWSSRQSIGAVVASNKFLSLLRNIYVSVRKYGEFPDKFHAWVNKIDLNKIPLPEYDLMISSSDGKTSHFVAERIKRQMPGLKWIQIWGDPWYDDLNYSGISKLRIKVAEQKILQKAEEIIYISEPTAELLQKRYPDLSTKIHFVPRSYLYEYNYEVCEKDDMHIIYTGTIRSFYGRNITSLADAIAAFNSTSRRKIYLDIYGSVDEDIIKSLSSEYVVFHKGVDVKQLGNIYEGANALLYVSNKVGSTQIPGKLYDYLGTSSLVLCLMNDVNDRIAEYIKTLGEKCLMIQNDIEHISESLPELVSRMSKDYQPVKSFSPIEIAKKIVTI